MVRIVSTEVYTSEQLAQSSRACDWLHARTMSVKSLQKLVWVIKSSSQVSGKLKADSINHCKDQISSLLYLSTQSNTLLKKSSHLMVISLCLRIQFPTMHFHCITKTSKFSQIPFPFNSLLILKTNLVSMPFPMPLLRRFSYA